MILLAESSNKANKSAESEPQNTGRPSASQLENVFNVLSETVRQKLSYLLTIKYQIFYQFSFPSYLFSH
jgi:hypothetical protein